MFANYFNFEQESEHTARPVVIKMTFVMLFFLLSFTIGSSMITEIINPQHQQENSPYCSAPYIAYDASRIGCLL